MDNHARYFSQPISKPQLLRLPRDIRVIIWRLLLVSHEVIRPRVRETYKRVKSLEGVEAAFLQLPSEKILAVVRICKDLKDETLSVYFGLNHFAFNGTWEMYTYLASTGLRGSYMKRISFVYYGSHQRLAFKQLSTCTSLNSLNVIVLAQTVKGSRMPRRDLFQARGMQSFMAIRGLPSCNVTFREALGSRLTAATAPRCGPPRPWRNSGLLIYGLNAGDKRRRFDEEHLKEVGRIITAQVNRGKDSECGEGKEA